MMNMIQIIKKAALDAVEQSSPVNIAYGTIESINPLEVSVNQKFTLTEEFLIVPERLLRYEVSLEHIHKFTDITPAGPQPESYTEKALEDKLVIREGLKVSDKVLLLREQGGQKYLILDRLVGK